MPEPIAQHGIKIAGEKSADHSLSSRQRRHRRPGEHVDSAILARRLGSRALLIWADPGESGLDSGAPIGIYTDNPELAEYVWEHFGSSAALAFAETWREI